MSEGMQMGRDLALLAPELTLLVAAAAALVAEMLRRPVAAAWLVVLGLAGGFAWSVTLLGSDTTVFSGTYRVDALAVWGKLVLLPAAAASLVLVRFGLRHEEREGTAYALLGFTTLGSVLLTGVGDVMMVVLGVLLTSLGSFVLVALRQDDPATEAGMKYFVFGSVTGALMAFGLTYWFGAVGSTLLADLPALQGAPLAGAAGLVGVTIGLGYKAALVPFHFWAPDAYDGGPLGVAAYLSVVPKVAALFALAQVVQDLPAGLAWRAVLAAVAVASMTYGNLAALTQTNLVRLLAYSSVAQSGYLLLGVVAWGRSDLAAPSLVVFAAAYAAMNLGAFAVVARLGRSLDEVQGAGRAAPWLGAGMVVFLLALVGIPPTGGFAGKLLLFGAALDAGYGWLAVVAVLNSVLSLAVYLRIVVALYRRPVGPVVRGGSPAIVAGVALVATLALGLGAEALLVHLP